MLQSSPTLLLASAHKLLQGSAKSEIQDAHHLWVDTYLGRMSDAKCGANQLTDLSVDYTPDFAIPKSLCKFHNDRHS